MGENKHEALKKIAVVASIFMLLECDRHFRAFGRALSSYH